MTAAKTKAPQDTSGFRKNPDRIMSGCEEPDARRTKGALKSETLRPASGWRGAERMIGTGESSGFSAEKKETVIEMTEEQMQTLLRNALMQAGMEMGETGDHWPVIKQTIKDLARDWEQVRTERRVYEELKVQLYAQLEKMEKDLKTITPEERAIVAPLLAQTREVFDAHFTEPEEEVLPYSESKGKEPLHIRRAKAIIHTLVEESDD